MSDFEEKKKELEALEGGERLEKAVAMHIHAINTPIMVAEGYLPEEEGGIVDAKGADRIRKAVEKLKFFTKELKSELIEYRSKKDG